MQKVSFKDTVCKEDPVRSRYFGAQDMAEKRLMDAEWIQRHRPAAMHQDRLNLLDPVDLSLTVEEDMLLQLGS